MGEGESKRPTRRSAAEYTALVRAEGLEQRRLLSVFDVRPDGPLRSIAEAAGLARPGDTVLIHPGTYREVVDLRRSGRPGAPITLAAATPGTVTLNGDGLPFLLGGTARHVSVQGITFDGCSNELGSAAVRVGTGWRLADVVVQNADGAGVLVYGRGATLERVTAQNNGQQGIGGSGCSDVLVKDSVIRNNNRGTADPVWAGGENAIEIDGLWYVDPLWEAGGGKWSRTRRVTLDNVESYDNGGPGIWFDYRNRRAVVRNCIVRDARPVRNGYEAAGINIELTAGGTLIENTVCARNPGGNIVVESSRNVTARGNTLVDGDVALNDWPRGRAYRVRNVRFTNNHMTNAFVQTGGKGWDVRSGPRKRIVFDSNVYQGFDGEPVFRWAGREFRTIESVRSELGFEIGGALT